MPTLEPYVGIPGTFLLPGYPTLAVSKTGLMFSTINNKKVNPRMLDNGNKKYPVVDIPGTNKSKIVHVMMAEMFIDKPDIDEKLIVNHKNGIKSDYRVANLEWVTSSGNNAHAYINGLRTQNKKIFYKDLMYSKEGSAYSISELARELVVSPGLLLAYLDNNSKLVKSDLLQGRYIFRLENESWPDINPLMIGEIPKFVKRPVKVRFLNGVCLYFEDMAALAFFIKEKRATVQMHVWRNDNSRKKKDLFNGMEISYVEDYFELDKIPPDSIICRNKIKKKCMGGQHKPLKIEVFDNETKTSKVWNSTSEFSKFLKVKKSTIQKKFKNGSCQHGKYLIKYLND